MGFFCILLISNDTELLTPFHALICCFHIFFCEVSVQRFCLFLLLDCLSFLLLSCSCFHSILWYLDTSTLSKIYFCKYLHKDYSFFIYFLNVSFYEYKFLILIKSNLSFFRIIYFYDLSRKYLPNPPNQENILMFSSISFMVLSFIYRPMFHLNLKCFVECEVSIRVTITMLMYVSSNSSSICWKSFFAPSASFEA